MADISTEDIRKGKEEILKTATGLENLKLDDLTDEELDTLYGIAGNLDEKVNDIMDSMDAIQAEEFDYEEAIRVHTGVSMKEAQIIYKEKLQERAKPKTGLDKIFELL